MMENSKNTLLTMIVLAVLACGASVLLIKMQVHPPGSPYSDEPMTGVEKFVQVCGAQGQKDGRCTSMAAIKKAFDFDLMAEIDSRYKKMKKTAADIAADRLTDEAYKECLKARSCAEVPMLDDKKPADTPKAKEISRTFWDLADGKSLTLDICKFMPLCATALVNNVVTIQKNKIVASKAKKS